MMMTKIDDGMVLAVSLFTAIVPPIGVMFAARVFFPPGSGYDESVLGFLLFFAPTYLIGWLFFIKWLLKKAKAARVAPANKWPW